MKDSFDWNELDSTDVVTHGVATTVVYFNPRGDIVIRQQGDSFGNDDQTIVLPVAYAEKLVLKIRSAISEVNDKN